MISMNNMKRKNMSQLVIVFVSCKILVLNRLQGKFFGIKTNYNKFMFYYLKLTLFSRKFSVVLVVCTNVMASETQQNHL